MRDPKTLAHRIVKPMPTITKQSELQHRRYGNGFSWAIRLHRKPYPNLYISPFIYVFGYELYFSSFIEIWHTDPKGDIGPPCHGRKFWKLHIHHMSISPSFWYDFRQKHITRCAWCGKKSSKELGRVNHSDGRTVYHAACSTAAHKALHDHHPAECYYCSGSIVWKRANKRDARRVARALFRQKN